MAAVFIYIVIFNNIKRLTEVRRFCLTEESPMSATKTHETFSALICNFLSFELSVKFTEHDLSVLDVLTLFVHESDLIDGNGGEQGSAGDKILPVVVEAEEVEDVVDGSHKEGTKEGTEYGTGTARHGNAADNDGSDYGKFKTLGGRSGHSTETGTEDDACKSAESAGNDVVKQNLSLNGDTGEDGGLLVTAYVPCLTEEVHVGSQEAHDDEYNKNLG